MLRWIMPEPISLQFYLDLECIAYGVRQENYLGLTRRVNVAQRG